MGVSSKKDMASGLFITIAIGLAIGTVMAFVSNAFVFGVEFLTQIRSSGLIEVVWNGATYDVTSIFTLIAAALLIYGIRRRLKLPDILVRRTAFMRPIAPIMSSMSKAAWARRWLLLWPQAVAHRLDNMARSCISAPPSAVGLNR